MKLTNLFFIVLFSSFLTMPHSWGRVTNDGGSGSVRNGGDPLRNRLTQAKAAAKAIVDSVNGSNLKASSKVREFYSKHLPMLRNEARCIQTVIRPRDEVFAAMNGRVQERPASTGNYDCSPILISRELNQNTSVQEMTFLLLHEIGHHTGHKDENSETEPKDGLLLDELADALLKAGLELNPQLFAAATHDQKSPTLWESSHSATREALKTNDGWPITFTSSFGAIQGKRRNWLSLEMITVIVLSAYSKVTRSDVQTLTEGTLVDHLKSSAHITEDWIKTNLLEEFVKEMRTALRNTRKFKPLSQGEMPVTYYYDVTIGSHHLDMPTLGDWIDYIYNFHTSNILPAEKTSTKIRRHRDDRRN